MPYFLENVYLIFYSGHIFLTHALFVDYFYGDLFLCGDVHCQIYFSKGSLPNIFAYILIKGTHEIISDYFGIGRQFDSLLSSRSVGGDSCGGF